MQVCGGDKGGILLLSLAFVRKFCGGVIGDSTLDTTSPLGFGELMSRLRLRSDEIRFLIKDHASLIL